MLQKLGGATPNLLEFEGDDGKPSSQPREKHTLDEFLAWGKNAKLDEQGTDLES